MPGKKAEADGLDDMVGLVALTRGKLSFVDFLSGVAPVEGEKNATKLLVELGGARQLDNIRLKPTNFDQIRPASTPFGCSLWCDD